MFPSSKQAEVSLEASYFVSYTLPRFLFVLVVWRGVCRALHARACIAIQSFVPLPVSLLSTLSLGSGHCPARGDSPFGPLVLEYGVLGFGLHRCATRRTSLPATHVSVVQCGTQPFGVCP